MINNAWLSILGLYKYDTSVFDGMTLPQASELDLTLPYMQDVVSDLNKDTLIFKILMDLAELPLVYTDPETVKYMITRWSLARTPVWRELWKTTLYKYVPIWNKDGVYDETRNLETTGSTSGSVEDKTTVGHTITGTSSTHTVTDQDTTELRSGSDRRDTTIAETTSGSETGTRDVETITDQDTTESKTGTSGSTKIVDQDTTETKSGTESRTTTTDQDTSKSGTNTGTGSLNRTVAHNVTGFDVDSYAPDTQDVTTETTSTQGNTSETGTNDVTETMTGQHSESGSGTNDVTETLSGTSTDSGTGTMDTTETIDEDTTRTTSGRRDVTQAESGSFTETGSGTNDVDVTETGQTNEILSGTGSLDRATEGSSEGSETETIHKVEQGNIGVTTTQQMIREQREIVLLDMYQVITDEFKKQFCIMVY